MALWNGVNWRFVTAMWLVIGFLFKKELANRLAPDADFQVFIAKCSDADVSVSGITEKCQKLKGKECLARLLLSFACISVELGAANSWAGN